MKRDLIFSGMIGTFLGLLIFFAAGLVKGFVPSLVSDLAKTLIVFAILFLFALIEMPVMAIGLRKMASSPSVPRGAIAGGFLAYVLFAGVYAALFVLITGDHYFYLGTVLAALGLALGERNFCPLKCTRNRATTRPLLSASCRGRARIKSW